MHTHTCTVSRSKRIAHVTLCCCTKLYVQHVQQECTAGVQQTPPTLAWQAVLESCCTKTVHAVQNCTEMCTADVQHVYSSVQQGKHDRQHPIQRGKHSRQTDMLIRIDCTAAKSRRSSAVLSQGHRGVRAGRVPGHRKGYRQTGIRQHSRPALSYVPVPGCRGVWSDLLLHAQTLLNEYEVTLSSLHCTLDSTDCWWLALYDTWNTTPHSCYHQQFYFLPCVILRYYDLRDDRMHVYLIGCIIVQ